MTLTVCSYGGGVQSTALLVMAAQGDLGIKTFLFANVGDDSEHPATLRYVHEVAMPYAEAHGVTIHELHRSGLTLHQYITRPGNKAETIPVRLANGMPASRVCTSKWKIEVLSRWLKANGATKDNPAQTNMGISLDEFQRMRSSSGYAHYTVAYPLIERRMTRQDCINAIQRSGLPVPPKSSCWFCFAGETEVITPNGAKPIKDLVGTATVLVPIAKSGISRWQDVEVRSFGEQPLMKITLRRTRSEKVIYATPEHRWVTIGKNQCWQPFKTTSELKPGDLIPSSRPKPILASHYPVVPSPFGIAQGFVFGDGHLEGDTKPASVILHGEKDLSMMPYFALCNPREVTLPSGKTGMYVYNLPRQWKERPPLTESRSFLLGWLAGYFAADGHVSLDGQAVIYSAQRDHMALVRDICYILGVQTSPIAKKVRDGFNGMEELYSVTLYSRDLPETFWINAHHKERVTVSQQTVGRRTDWQVVSVEPTDRVEEVFCAIVPEREMFVLADNIVTGNCPFHRMSRWREMANTEPELFAQAVALEQHLNTNIREPKGKDKVWLTDALRPIDKAVGSMAQGKLFDGAEPTCDSGFCFM